MPATIRRIWNCTNNSSASHTIWDRGDELWEMRNDCLRHFRVVSRNFLENPKKLEEILEVLDDSPIPLETLVRSCTGWDITEEIISQDLPPTRQDLPPLQHEQKSRAQRPSQMQPVMSLQV